MPLFGVEVGKCVGVLVGEWLGTYPVYQLVPWCLVGQEVLLSTRKCNRSYSRVTYGKYGASKL